MDEYGALNSKPVFDAFANSLNNNGHDVTYNDLVPMLMLFGACCLMEEWLETKQSGSNKNQQ